MAFNLSYKENLVTGVPQDNPRRHQPNLSKAKALLNWEPEVALADGPKETIACFWHSLELS